MCYRHFCASCQGAWNVNNYRDPQSLNMLFLPLKEQGQLIKPSPAAIKNTAQSSPTTLKNKAECKVQIAEAVSHGGRSDDESESSTGSPATSASAVQSASNGAERNIEVILIDCYKVVLRDEELS